MGNWNQVLDEIKEVGGAHDVIRRRHLTKLAQITGRNVIVYYSGWLQKPTLEGVGINDADKNGFMTVIHGLDRSKGLDLLLHTPGGDIAATESIVHYLRSMFGTDIRAIIPQLAMSSGTMVACSCKQIIMGKQSSLGPIDPQIAGCAAHGILEELERAYKEIQADNVKAAVWHPILQGYSPTLVGECEKAIEWSETLVRDWLRSGMFAKYKNPTSKIVKILKELGDHSVNLNHSRHLPADKCAQIGLDIVMMEKDPPLQDAVLTAHHSLIHTLSATLAFKVIENQMGTAYIQTVPPGRRDLIS